MQLTQFTDYSLRTLMYLANNQDRLCTVKEIAMYYKISQHHLVKVVHKLAKLNYIQSNKGKGGGIKILKNPNAVNLRDLVMQLEPNLTLVECFDPKINNCRITMTCGLKTILNQSLNAFLENLAKYTLADILQKI